MTIKSKTCEKKVELQDIEVNSNTNEGEKIPLQAIRESSMAEEYFRTTIAKLGYPYLTHLVPEFEQLIESVIGRFAERTKFANFPKLAPIMLYLFLKQKGIFVNLRQYRSLLDLSYSKFVADVKRVIQGYKEYHQRDKTRIIQEFIRFILFKLTQEPVHHFIALSIYNYVRPFLQFTKEETVCGVVCVLTSLVLPELNSSHIVISHMVGVSAGAAYNTIKSKILPHLDLPPIKGLSKSAAPVREALIRKIIPGSWYPEIFRENLLSYYEIEYVKKAYNSGRPKPHIARSIGRSVHLVERMIDYDIDAEELGLKK
jgi:hypothetical protein